MKFNTYKFKKYLICQLLMFFVYFVILLNYLPVCKQVNEYYLELRNCKYYNVIIRLKYGYLKI